MLNANCDLDEQALSVIDDIISQVCFWVLLVSNSLFGPSHMVAVELLEIHKWIEVSVQLEVHLLHNMKGVMRLTSCTHFMLPDWSLWFT
jgi:hypothetical protein